MNEDNVNNVIKALSTSLEAQNLLPALRAQLEEKFSERPYQLMAVYQRNRHNRTEGEEWPDKPETAPAVSRYPNILAELDASGWWLDRIARCARVSMEIMATVMDDNGELSWDELESLARCFECKTDYLAAPALSMVDPATNKGKSRIQRLRALLRQTEGMDRYFYRKNSSDVLPKLESGKPVTYASYRWACKNLQNVLDAQAREEVRQQSIRTGKLSPARAREKVQMDLRTRIQQARERDNARKLKNRLAEIRKYVNDTKVEIGGGNDLKDLYALADFSSQDLFGALLLALMYGQAQGYRAAGGEAA